MQRRQFIKVASVGAGLGLAQGSRLVRASETSTEMNTLLVFLRGGADGLNIVTPYGDPDYFTHRPDIAIPAPGEVAGALALDSMFGLHPSMASFIPLFEQGDLAIVHAAGGTHGSRSHFDAQSLMERGINDKTGVFSGWLGRYAETLANAYSTTFHQVAMGDAISLSLLGDAPAMAVSSIDAVDLILPSQSSGILKQVLASAYSGSSPLAQAGQHALMAVEEIQAADPAQFTPLATYPETAFGRSMMEAAQLLKSSLGCHLMTFNLGGWDHHVDENQQLTPLVEELADTLSAFHTDMGPLINNTRVIVVSEFGRRVAQNGAMGTDHGSGNCVFVMGGGVNGGKVYADWPGLSSDNLVLGDLAVTTDYRQIMVECLLAEQPNLDWQKVFPEYAGGSPLGLFTA